MGLLDFLSPNKLNRKLLLTRAKQAIEKTHKQGRLKFIISDNNKVEYTDKKGRKEVMEIKECSAEFWDILSRELEAKTMGSHNFASLKISLEDIEGLIKGLR